MLYKSRLIVEFWHCITMVNAYLSEGISTDLLRDPLVKKCPTTQKVDKHFLISK